MNEIVNLNFESHLVRIVMVNGEPWFVANDVCACLGLSNPRKAVADLNDDEKGVTTSDTLGGDQKLNIISEPGVYRLVFRSRKPEAERFKRWLAHEVLPKLRKQGYYIAPGATLPAVEAPIDDRMRALAMVTECRLTHGRAAAARLWRSLGLPDVSAEALSAPVDEDAQACLARLLAMPVEGRTLGEALRAGFAAEHAAQQQLHRLKIRIAFGGWSLPLVSAEIAAWFAATPWPRPFETLRRLPRARAAHPNGGARARDALWLPSETLG